MDTKFLAAVLFRILEFVHEALTSNVVFSKRLHGFEDTTFLDEYDRFIKLTAAKLGTSITRILHSSNRKEWSIG